MITRHKEEKIEETYSRWDDGMEVRVNLQNKLTLDISEDGHECQLEIKSSTCKALDALCDDVKLTREALLSRASEVLVLLESNLIRESIDSWIDEVDTEVLMVDPLIAQTFKVEARDRALEAGILVDACLRLLPRIISDADQQAVDLYESYTDDIWGIVRDIDELKFKYIDDFPGHDGYVPDVIDWVNGELGCLAKAINDRIAGKDWPQLSRPPGDATTAPES